MQSFTCRDFISVCVVCKFTLYTYISCYKKLESRGTKLTYSTFNASAIMQYCVMQLHFHPISFNTNTSQPFLHVYYVFTLFL